MSKLIKGHYSCHLGRKKPVARLSQMSAEEAARRGLMKVQREIRVNGRDQWIPVWVEPGCEGLETDDPAVFEAHMKEHHPERFRYARGANSTLVARVSTKWRVPKAQPEGTPVKTDADLKTCPACGLVAEVGDRAADVLWWDEHTRMCAGTEAGAA